MATAADRIAVIKVGARGLNGVGVAAAAWAALQAMVASATTGEITVTVTDTSAVQIRKADETVLANFNTNGMLISAWNGASFAGFSDAGIAEVFRLDAGNGHIITSGVAPAVVAGAAAGSGPGAITVSGDDTSGRGSFTTGTSPTTGTLFTVTFGATYPAAPSCIVPVAVSAGAGGLGLYTASYATTGFVIGCAVAPPATTAITVGWIVIG